MSVRAKVVCTSKLLGLHHNDDGTNVESASVSFTAIFVGGPNSSGQAVEENKIFGKWTPNAQFSMYITNPAAHKQFEQGRFYYVDFSEAPE